MAISAVAADAAAATAEICRNFNGIWARQGKHMLEGYGFVCVYIFMYGCMYKKQHAFMNSYK